jgi:Aminoglycoside-2''-adenylyltransferase
MTPTTRREWLAHCPPGFGPLWAALTVLPEVQAPWAVAGGWALDLFLGRVTRAHGDVDLAVLRRDQLAWQAALTAHGWTLNVAHGGALRPWREQERLELPLHGIWATHPTHGFLELLLNESDAAGAFRFRRDPSLVLPLERAFVPSPHGPPILAPKVVLLYKASDPTRAENAADWREASPALSAEARAWLVSPLTRVSPEHPWLPETERSGA